jgi:small subunit ribosomal protein S2
MEQTGRALRQVAKAGKSILFVATKKQARDIVREAALSVEMPYVTNRWLGGMMTNFSTIRRSIKKMQNIDRMLSDGTLDNVTKKERLTLSRERDKLERDLGGIAKLNRLPHAIFVVDIAHEHLAISEAKKLGLKTFAMVDTNSNPNDVDFAIPSNDDATTSIEIVIDYVTQSIKEGLEERRKQKTKSKQNADAS